MKCNENFLSYSLFRKHSYTVHSAPTVLCNICGKLFRNKSRLNDHLEIHDDRNKHHCEICDTPVKTVFALRRHKFFHSVNGQECPDCGETYNFSSIRGFYAHRDSHKPTTKTKWICDECGQCCKTLPILREHKKRHSGVSYICELCKKSFTSKAGLVKHINNIHVGKRHICHVCGKELTTSATLKEHMTIHTGDRTHACEVCGKKYFRLGLLKAHMVAHMADKPYKCRYCGKEFNNSANLKHHEQGLHENIKPYKCEQCDKGFTIRAKLERHQRSVHSV